MIPATAKNTPKSYLNLRWTLEDIDSIQTLAGKGRTAAEIAELHLTKEDEIIALCRRNNIFVRTKSARAAK